MLRKMIENILPNILFIIILFIFIGQIIARYIYRIPFIWSYEITYILYLWLVLLGAIKVRRCRMDVRFDLVYEEWIPDKLKPWVAATTELLVGGVYLFLMYVSITYIITNIKEKTTILQLPTYYINVSFLIYTIGICIYSFYDLYLFLIDKWNKK